MYATRCSCTLSHFSNANFEKFLMTAKTVCLRIKVAQLKSFGWNFFVVGKLSQNSHKPVLIFWSSIPCVSVYSVCTLLKVVGYYDFSVCQCQ